MTSITLVTESKLYLKDNTPLYDYFDEYSKLFSFLVRRCVHHLRHQLNDESESRYRTNLMLEFNITNRMAKAVVKTAKNQLKLLKEAARYRYNNLYKRKRSLYKKIQKLKSLLSSSSTSLKQRKLVKLRLFWIQMKLNKVNQLISNGLRLQLTFGTNVLKNKEAKTHILKTLSKKKSSPLTYRIIKRDNVLYLQIMYRRETSDVTRNHYGVLGVDFNKGFISVSEISSEGKLQSLTRYTYLHQGKATKTKASMLKLVSKLVSQAVSVGKDIVIEDLVSLDSNKKQEKTTSKYYNRMINNLKFGLFKRCLLSKAPKEGVSVQFVNPYNTSKIARASYTDRMKLNVHDAASYVIARRFYQYD